MKSFDSMYISLKSASTQFSNPDEIVLALEEGALQAYGRLLTQEDKEFQEKGVIVISDDDKPYKVPLTEIDQNLWGYSVVELDNNKIFKRFSVSGKNDYVEYTDVKLFKSIFNEYSNSNDRTPTLSSTTLGEVSRKKGGAPRKIDEKIFYPQLAAFLINRKTDIKTDFRDNKTEFLKAIQVGLPYLQDMDNNSDDDTDPYHIRTLGRSVKTFLEEYFNTLDYIDNQD